MTGRTDLPLLVNAMLGQFISGFAARMFVVSFPTIARGLHADILGISWAIVAYQLAGISLSVVFGRLGDVPGRHAIYGGGFVIMTASSLLGISLAGVPSVSNSASRLRLDHSVLAGVFTASAHDG